MHETEKYQELIIKDLAKELTLAEQAELREWLSQRPENQALYDQFADSLKKVNAATETFTPDVNAAWSAMQQKMRFAEESTDKPEKTKVISLFSSPAFRIAASLLVIFLAGILSYRFFGSTEQLTLASGSERKLFVLPDSSKVWLNPQSSLSYEKELSGEQRVVKLNGEGFFEIKRDETRPFVVEGIKTSVRVLGTSFVVHSSLKDSMEFVLVSTGKVSFSETGKSGTEVLLTAGDQAFYVPGKPVSKKEKSTSNAGAWKNNRLVFNNTPLNEVLSDLQLYFHKKIEVSTPALLNCRFTGSFDAPDLDAVLVVLSMSVNSSFQPKENGYMLQGAGCN